MQTTTLPRRRLLKSAATLLCGTALSNLAKADSGVILFGQSAVLSGPSARLGIEMRDGINAAFEQLNVSGGIAGRQLKLRTYDDGYEPARTTVNTSRLLETGCFALMGYVGTPTSLAVAPLITSERVPFLGPFTGATGLRNPINPWIFNVRAGYKDEAGPIVKQLISGTDTYEKLGIIYQDDAYGQSVRAEVETSLEMFGMKPAVTATVKRNSPEVKTAAQAVAKAGATSVVLASVYSTSAALMAEIRSLGLQPKFASVSFVGTSALTEQFPEAAVGLAIAQVMPSPWASKVPLVRQYQTAMRAVGATKFNYGSIEGYVTARVCIEALRRCNGNITRGNFREQLEHLNLDLDGFRVAFSAVNHQASTFTEMSVIGKDGRVLL